MSIHPALALLALFALPTVVTVDLATRGRARRAGARRAVQPACASSLRDVDDRAAGERSARHRHRRPAHCRTALCLANGSRARRSSAVGIGGMAHARVGRVWRGIRRRGGVRRARLRVVGGQCAARAGRWITVVRVHRRDRRRNRIPARLLVYGARRLAWLEDYAASLVASADLPVPARSPTGIRLEHVSFAYPGTDRLVLDDVNLDLPAGAVVAIVGENGAGKSTLVKLLAQNVRADVAVAF